MSQDVTDFAALISQYEATEHDMLNNLDAASAATDGTPAKSNGDDTPLPLLASNPRRNAPTFSDSDDSDDDSENENEETSYTEEEDHPSESNEPFAYESDTNGAEETSYTEGNDDDDASESEEDGSQSEEFESDSDDEDQSSQPSYTEEGTSEHSEDDSHSREKSPSTSSRSMDPDGINATSAFDELAPILNERTNPPIFDSDDSDSENQDGKASHIISPVPSKSIQRRNAPVMDSDSDSDSDSDNASYEEDSQQGSAQSGFESDQEEIRRGGNNTNQKPESARSYDSYETDDSEGNDDNDEGSASFYESGDESSNDGGDNDNDDSDSDDSDSSYSKDSQDEPTFNQRGRSNRGFQHPNIESNSDDSDSDSSSSSSSSSSDSDNSGWGDTGAMSHSESANDEHFENEPEKASILGADDNIEIESDSSESGFEDEPPSKRKTKNKSKKGKKGKKGKSKKKKSSDSDSDSSSDSDSDSSSDSSESEFDDEDHTINVYDGEEGRSTASTSKRKKRGSTNLSSTERSAEREHILSREKLVNDRENTVNTRERKFTKWFIIAAGIILLLAIILVAVYFSRRGKTPAPTPSTVTITLPTEMPVTIPIGVPAPPTTDAPTALPANKVIVETSFLAFIRDGKTSGLTTEGLESELKIILPIFLPGLLDDVVDEGVLTARARRFLRRLQNDKLEIDDAIDVDASEIDCPQGGSNTDLCVRVTTNIPIINSSDDFTQEFASGLQTAFSDALIQRIDGGVLQQIGSSVKLGVYEEGEALPTVAPTVAPKDTTAPTAAPTPLRGSAVPTGVGNSSVTLSPTPVTNSTSNSTTAPSPTEAPTAELTGVPTPFGTVDPDQSQAPSPAPVSNNSTTTSSPTVAPTVTPVCEDRNEACQEVGESGNCTQTKCAFWASEGECTSNPNYMNVNCEQSCGLCGDGEGPPEPECSDENESCPEWAVQGECTKNEAYMSLNCKDSCGYCSCEDKNADCADFLSSANACIQFKCELWKSQGECENNAEYMDVFCRKSCESCIDASCIDEDSRCGGWAETGECGENPEYMSRNCKKSCNKCG